MAAKVKMLKLLQEIRGFAQVTNRRPPPRFPGLVLTAIRATAAQDNPHRRKLSIAFDKHTQPNTPHRVKITHVKPAAHRATMVQVS